MKGLPLKIPPKRNLRLSIGPIILIGFLLVLLIVLSLSTVLIVSPYFIQAVDRLLLLAPCCPDPSASANPEMTSTQSTAPHNVRKNHNWDIRDLMSWYILHSIMSYSKLGNCCDVCQRYRKFRCVVRLDSVIMNEVNWWDGVTLVNATIRSSDDDCEIVDSFLRSKNSASLDPMPLRALVQRYWKKNKKLSLVSIPMNGVQDAQAEHDDDDDIREDEELLISSSTPHPSPKDAIQISSLSLHWNKLSQPIFNINAANITLYLTLGEGRLPLEFPIDFGRSVHQDPTSSGTSSIRTHSLPVPFLKIGGKWTIGDVISMLPDPPKEAGGYPRLGVVNVTNVKIVVRREHHYPHDRTDDGVHDDVVFKIPDDMFKPLFDLTTEAGVGGVDQTKIQHLFVEAFTIAVRKHVLGEENNAIFETTWCKSAQFVDALHGYLNEIIHDGSAVIGEVVQDASIAIDHQLERLASAVQQVVDKVEEEWKGIQEEYQLKASMSGMGMMIDETFEQIKVFIREVEKITKWKWNKFGMH